MFNNQDYILRKKGILSKEKCNEIINFFEDRKDLQRVGSSGVGDAKTTNPTHKAATEIYLTTYNDNVVFPIISRSVGECILEYKKLYPFLDMLSPWSILPTYKIQRYKPKEGYFSLHCENEGLENEEQYKRILTWMIYLNDVKDGGYTEFPTQNKKFQPRRGDILVWPAYWTHPHRGITSRTQTKYIMTGWHRINTHRLM